MFPSRVAATSTTRRCWTARWNLDDLYVHDLGAQTGATGRIAEANALVNSGGTVHVQSGTYGEDVIIGSGVTYSPGSSPGINTVGSLTQANGSTLLMEIDGTAGPGLAGGHDQIIVDSVTAGGGTGAVNLDGTLDVAFGYVPAPGDSWELIDKVDAGAISGTFAAPAGTSFVGTSSTGGSIPLTLDYAGDDGNDLVLSVTSFSTLYAAKSLADAALAFTITTDTGATGFSVGDIVTFNAPGEAPVSGLLFGYEAFASITDALAVAPDGGQIFAAGFEVLEDGGPLGIDVATGSSFTIDSFSLGTGFFGTLTKDVGDQAFTYNVLPAAPDTSGINEFDFAASNGVSVDGTVWIDVLPVNDQPTFNLAASHTSAEGAGAQSQSGFASSIDLGANETTQTGTFTVTSNTVDSTLTFTTPPSISASGELTYEAATDAFGTGTFDVILKDDGGTANGGVDTSTTATFTISVTADNDAPVVDDATFSIAENALVGASVGTVSFSDVDGPSLSFSISGSDFSIDSSGNITVAQPLDFETTSSYSLTVTVEDNHPTDSKSDTATITINILNVNEVTDAVDDSYSVDEDTTLNVTLTASGVLANDSDEDNDPLEVTQLNSNALSGGSATDTTDKGGTVTLNSDGTFSYTPAPDYFSGDDDSFTYTISDGNGGTDTATVSITVNPVQDPVDAMDDAYTTDEDTPLTITAGGAPEGLLFNDVDPDGDPLLAFQLTGPTNGSVTFSNDGSFVYTPNADFNGTDSFTYFATDGLSTDTATVTITVTAVNDDPVVSGPEAITLTEDDASTTLDLLGNASDVEGDTLNVASLTLVSGAGSGITASGNSLTIDPSAYNSLADGESEVITYSYDIEDGNGGSVSQAATVTITGVNDAPTANADSATTDEDTSIAVAVLTNDTDPDTSDTLTIDTFDASSTQGGTVTESSGVLTYAPPAEFNGTDTFTYTISDGKGGTSTATVTVTVDPINDDPIATNDSATILEDSGTTIVDVLANDVPGPANESGQNLTVVGLSGQPGPTVATVAVFGNKIEVTPAANYSGSFTVTYTVRDDGQSGNPLVNAFKEDTATLTVTVEADSDAPVLTVANASGNEDTPIPLNITATLSDPSETLSDVTISGVPAGALLSAGTDMTGGVWTVPVASLLGLTITPPADDNSDFTLTVSVSSTDAPDTAETVSDTIDVTVNAINDAPVITVPAAQTTAEDTSLTITGISVSDVDVDETIGGELEATLSVTSGTITLSAGSGVTVTGGAEGSATVTFTGTEAEINAALNGLVYTPNADYNGLDTLDITVDDQGNTGAPGNPVTPASVDISVTAVNDPPVANDDADTTDEDMPVDIDVAANDTDVDDLIDPASIAIVTGPTNGTATPNPDGTVTYTPADDFNGTDSFTYTIDDDSEDTSNTATVTVTVNPVNDAPVADDATLGVVEGTTLAFDLQTLVDDIETADGDLIFAVNTSPSNGNLTASGPDGVWVYEPDPGFNGTDTLVYEVMDTGDGSSVAITESGTITFLVLPFNDAPVITSPATETTAEDTPLTFSTGTATEISVADPDVGTGEHEVTLLVSNGTLTLATGSGVAITDGADGSPTVTFTGTEAQVNAALNGLVYTPNADYNGPDTLDITVDDQGNTGAPGNQVKTESVAISVTAVNDPPVANPDTGSTDEDTSLTVDVLDNDTDVDDLPADLSLDSIDGVTVTSSNATINGIAASSAVSFTGPDVTFDPTGLFDALQAGETATVVIDYTMSDDDSATASSTLTITVTGVNDAPVAVNDTAYATDEDSLLTIAAPGLLSNDTDVEGNSLTVVEVEGQTANVGTTIPLGNGLLTVLSDGSFTFDPNGAYESLAVGQSATETFTYLPNDGTVDAAAPATVTITINGVNDAPVAVADSYSTPEDTPLVVTAPGVLANDSDIDVDTLTAIQLTPPSNGTLSLASNGSFTYTPNLDFVGSDSFTYVAFDGVAASAVQTVTIDVTAVNDAPVANSDTGTTDEDTSLTVDVLDNDTDVDDLPADLSLDSIDGVTVTSSNATINGIDASSAVSFTSPNVTFDPAGLFDALKASETATVVIDYTMSDDDGASASSTLTITVTGANDAPVAVDDATYATDEDSVLTVAAPGLLGNDTDVENDLLSVVKVNGDSLNVGSTIALGGGSLTVQSDGSFTFNPDGGYESLAVGDTATETFTYLPNDGTVDAAAPATVTITINGVNDAPVAVAASFTTDEDIVLSNSLPAGSDVDTDDTLTYHPDVLPANGSLLLSIRTAPSLTRQILNTTARMPSLITWKMATVAVSATQIVLITVNAVDDPTTAGNVTLADINEDASLPFSESQLLANSSDVDDPISVTSVTVTAGMGTISGTSPSWTFTPDANWNGPVEITFAVTGSTTDTAIATFNVLSVEDAPVANPDSYTMLEDGTLTTTDVDGTVTTGDPSDDGVLANDTDGDGDTLTATVTDTTDNGLLTLSSDGTFTYTPDEDFAGVDTFDYEVSDGNGGTDTATVTINVTAVNDAPTYELGADQVVPAGSVESVPGFLTNADPGGGSR